MVTNGWRRRRAIKGKCPNFQKRRFLPLETSVASSETVIAPFDKKNQFGTLAFSHNSNFKFWSERGTFYAKSGSQGRQRRNSGCFRNVTNIFPLVDLGQNWLNTVCFLQFTTEKEIYLVPLTERLHPILIISRSQSILKEKCGLLFPRW